jgi:hypothetical protein
VDLAVIGSICKEHQNRWYPRPGLNRHVECSTQDFKSCASSVSATWVHRCAYSNSGALCHQFSEGISNSNKDAAFDVFTVVIGKSPQSAEAKRRADSCGVLRQGAGGGDSRR